MVWSDNNGNDKSIYSNELKHNPLTQMKENGTMAIVGLQRQGTSREWSSNLDNVHLPPLRFKDSNTCENNQCIGGNNIFNKKNQSIDFTFNEPGLAEQRGYNFINFRR